MKLLLVMLLDRICTKCTEKIEILIIERSKRAASYLKIL